MEVSRNLDFNRKVSVKSLISTFVSKFPDIKLTAILLSSQKKSMQRNLSEQLAYGLPFWTQRNRRFLVLR